LQAVEGKATLGVAESFATPSAENDLVVVEELCADADPGDGCASHRVGDRPGDPTGRFEDHGVERPGSFGGDDPRADVAWVQGHQRGGGLLGHDQAVPAPLIRHRCAQGPLIGFELAGADVDRVLTLPVEDLHGDTDPGDRLALGVDERAVELVVPGQECEQQRIGGSAGWASAVPGRQTAKVEGPPAQRVAFEGEEADESVRRIAREHDAAVGVGGEGARGVPGPEDPDLDTRRALAVLLDHADVDRPGLVLRLRRSGGRRPGAGFRGVARLLHPHQGRRGGDEPHPHQHRPEPHRVHDDPPFQLAPHDRGDHRRDRTARHGLGDPRAE
jgi:hypothetical protein